MYLSVDSQEPLTTQFGFSKLINHMSVKTTRFPNWISQTQLKEMTFRAKITLNDNICSKTQYLFIPLNAITTR